MTAPTQLAELDQQTVNGLHFLKESAGLETFNETVRFAVGISCSIQKAADRGEEIWVFNRSTGENRQLAITMER